MYRTTGAAAGEGAGVAGLAVGPAGVRAGAGVVVGLAAVSASATTCGTVVAVKRGRGDADCTVAAGAEPGAVALAAVGTGSTTPAVGVLSRPDS